VLYISPINYLSSVQTCYRPLTLDYCKKKLSEKITRPFFCLTADDRRECCVPGRTRTNRCSCCRDGKQGASLRWQQRVVQISTSNASGPTWKRRGCNSTTYQPSLCVELVAPLPTCSSSTVLLQEKERVEYRVY
jgi:hypothetical protein